MKGLKDKVALVTGGGGRIGAAVGARLVEEGARVVLADLDLDAANRVASRLGASAHAVQFDAEQPDSIQAMVEAAVDQFGALDILHNNAALVRPDVLNADTTVTDVPVEVWDRTMDVNVRGYLLASKYAIPHIRKQGGGAIINSASDAALAGDMLRIAYGTSKGAIVTLTKYIATQFGRDNIRCNVILPGLMVDAEMEERLPQLTATTKRHLLLTRNGRPEDIAALVAFFASDDGAFITGQAISCDGGMLSHQPHFADFLEGTDLSV